MEIYTKNSLRKGKGFMCIFSFFLPIGEGCEGKHDSSAHNIHLICLHVLSDKSNISLYKSINLEWNYFPNLRGGGIDLETTKFELGYII